MKTVVPDNLIFSKLDLKRLIIPLIIEQILAVTVGMSDVVMVSSLGDAAVSGVSLVDMMNQLIISVFAALATGGAVVASQLIGAKERQRACGAARQLIFIVAVISIVITVLSLLFSTQLLRLLFGDVDALVMQSSMTYFHLSALSYPFLALYSAGAALFRAQGNARVTMTVSVGANLLNIAGNALFIFGFNMGVAGAATSSLIARMLSSMVILALLRKPRLKITLMGRGKFRPDKPLIGRILGIGVPNGIENFVFQMGRVMVVSMIALFGTTQIAANAVANNLDALAALPGTALSLAMITVIGQCVGANNYEQARYYAKKLLKIAYIAIGIFSLVILATLPLSLKLYGNLSAETVKLAIMLICIHNGFAMLLWPLSFTMPNVLRAANDVRFAMVVSIVSMLLFRCVGAYIIGVRFGLGAIGVWIAMVMDWFVRVCLFVWRYRSGKWTKKCVNIGDVPALKAVGDMPIDGV